MECLMNLPPTLKLETKSIVHTYCVQSPNSFIFVGVVGGWGRVGGGQVG